jgi:hypothetical protein
LGFFLDPSEKHGLNTLFIDALMQTAELEIVSGKSDFRIQDVQLEKSIPGGRIDLCIDADDHGIILENKINHQPNNPWDNYEEWGRKQWKRPHFILLSLHRIPDSEQPKNFKCILYRDFLRELRNRLGDYIMAADAVCVGYLIEFMTAIDHSENEEQDNRETLEFFAESDNFDRFLILKSRADELARFLRGKLEILEDALLKEPGFNQAYKFSGREKSPLKQKRDEKHFGIFEQTEFTATGNLKDRKLKVWIGQSGWWLEVYEAGEWVSNKLWTAIKSSNQQLIAGVESPEETREGENFLLGEATEDAVLIAEKLAKLVPFLNTRI